MKIAEGWRKTEELPRWFMESHCRAEQGKVQAQTSELLRGWEMQGGEWGGGWEVKSTGRESDGCFWNLEGSRSALKIQTQGL